MSTGLKLYIDFCIFVLGASIGSFLNVVVHRLPREESLVYPPSHCPGCDTRIRWSDNIPLVSWLALSGKCRKCGIPIAARYFLVELLTALLFLAVWVKFGLWLTPIYWLLLAGLIAGTFIDFEHFIIPDEITLGGVVVGFVASLAYPPLHGVESIGAAALRAGLGILVGGGSLWLIVELGKLIFGRKKVPLDPGTAVRIADGKLSFAGEEVTWDEMFMRNSDRLRFHAATLTCAGKTYENAQVAVAFDHIEVNGEKVLLKDTGPIDATTDLLIIPREAMGMGDVKLMAGIGAFLGWQAVVFTVVASSLDGGVLGLLLILTGRHEWQSRIPFGPYIALGALLWMFFGPQTVNWYVNMLQGG